ncbi:MAG: GNAT family N-acetyltransferase, partial [Woeseiaceae bacterium]|nr:GNAT family N-acetyltransferase [Woeseiaceae bacterium]
PDFLLSSLVNIQPDDEVLIIIVERRVGTEWQAIFMGVFNEVAYGPLVPFRYLDAYRAPHAFLTGLLLHRECPDTALEAFFEQVVRANRGRWSAVRLVCYPRTRAVSDASDRSLRERKVHWHEYCPEQRASIAPSSVPADYLEKQLSRRSLRNLRRKKRQLESMGEYEWRFVPSAEVGERTIAEFLRLEDLGWKGHEGSSLIATPGHQRFFEEMITKLAARGQVFFTEILLDGEVIASTSNLMSGRSGFAFKLGWDPAYARQSIGILNELELIEHMPTYLADIDHMDSGAMPGSFMEDLWSGRDTLSGGYYATDAKSTFYIQAYKMAATIKRCLKGQW